MSNGECTSRSSSMAESWSWGESYSESVGYWSGTIEDVVGGESFTHDHDGDGIDIANDPIGIANDYIRIADISGDPAAIDDDTLPMVRVDDTVTILLDRFAAELRVLRALLTSAERKRLHAALMELVTRQLGRPGRAQGGA